MAVIKVENRLKSPTDFTDEPEIMLNGQLANTAWMKYAEEVRRDPTNLYYCTRLPKSSCTFAALLSVGHAGILQANPP